MFFWGGGSIMLKMGLLFFEPSSFALGYEGGVV